MRIALDIDGVLADFNTRFIEYAAKEGLSGYFPASADEITQWHYADKKHIQYVFDKIALDAEFWLGVPTYKDTTNLPFKPLAYITARPIGNEVSMRWLWRHNFPEAPVYTVKNGEDKLLILRELFPGATFVDDKQETVQHLNDNGVKCFVFDQGWNRGLDAKYERVFNLSHFGVTEVSFASTRN